MRKTAQVGKPGIRINELDKVRIQAVLLLELGYQHS